MKRESGVREMPYDPSHLVNLFIDRVPNVVRGIGRSTDPHVQEENLSLAYLALVECAHRWESYCERNEYDPEATGYFWTYAYRRMDGAIKDNYRRADSMSRYQRDKYKQNGAPPPVYQSKITMTVDLSDPELRITDTSPDADHLLVVNQAQRAAYRAYVALPVSQQISLAVRLRGHPIKDWGNLWSGEREAGAVSAHAAREIYRSVCDLLGKEPEVRHLQEDVKRFIAESPDWKPSEQFLEFLSTDMDDYIEQFGHEILVDYGVVLQIIALARLHKKQPPRSGPRR